MEKGNYFLSLNATPFPLPAFRYETHSGPEVLEVNLCLIQRRKQRKKKKKDKVENLTLYSVFNFHIPVILEANLT